jgi:Chaperone of endosialidase
MMKSRKMTCKTILCALACFALCPVAQAVVPPPDGGYPGFNTAEGQNALFSLAGGVWNTALGGFTLFSDTTGGANTAVGLNALRFNVDGTSNTAVGVQSLFVNATGDQNCAFGVFSLFANTASGNSAFGFAALAHNTSGVQNTAVGTNALLNNTGGGGLAGSLNTAVGHDALTANTTGFENTAVGVNALQATTGGTAVANTALGHSAGFNATTGSGNVYIGANMLGVAGESNACYIRSISGRTVDLATANTVLIDDNNKLGTVASSQRFKRDIKPMDKASEAILALKPVTFHYKSDAKNTPCFGLIAEEVAKVNPDLVVRNNDGELMSVRYDQVNAMLLNEFLKEHKKVQELETTVAQQAKGMEVLTAQLKEQAAQIQKVSAQLEVNKPAPRTIANK